MQMTLQGSDVYEVPSAGPGLQTAGAGLETLAMFVTSLVADILAERFGSNGRADSPAFQGAGGVELHVHCGSRDRCRCEPEDGCGCDDC